MPVIPKESSGLEPSQKKANTPQQGQGGAAKAKPTDQDFSSHGPQIPDKNSLPPKASREEIETKMQELNK